MALLLRSPAWGQLRAPADCRYADGGPESTHGVPPDWFVAWVVKVPRPLLSANHRHSYIPGLPGRQDLCRPGPMGGASNIEIVAARSRTQPMNEYSWADTPNMLKHVLCSSGFAEPRLALDVNGSRQIGAQVEINLRG